MNINNNLHPIEELIREHREVEKDLQLLDEQLRTVEKNSTFTSENKSWLKNWLDKFDRDIRLHIEKEDNVLFKSMEKYIPVQGGPLAVMDYEHRAIENCTQKLYEGIQNGIEIKAGILNDYCEVGFSLIDTLHAHIGKEEQILFPMATQILSEEDMNWVAQRYAELNINN